MPLILTIAAAVAAILLSVLFASLTYSLREYSRPDLAEFLGKRDADRWYEYITDNTADLIFLTAIGRQMANILFFLIVFTGLEQTSYSQPVRYLLTILIAGFSAVVFSVSIPHTVARYASAQIVGFFAPILRINGVIFRPVARMMHGVDEFVRRAFGIKEAPPQTQIQAEILSAFEEGEEEGVVDEQERDMIESVIEFRQTTAGQIMTTRQEIDALHISATLAQIKTKIELSGHSRIPVFEESLDHITGILYARDLLKYLGEDAGQFSARTVMRPVIYVPENKPLRDLLTDMRIQKVQIAIVLDEYGLTSGLVTFEDVVEELVGEVTDEHEPHEPAMYKRIDDATSEADARLRIEELNRLAGLSLSEDAGYETLGGFLITSLAKIPEKGATLDHGGVRYTVLDAQPQRVRRVKIERLPQPATPEAGH